MSLERLVRRGAESSEVISIGGGLPAPELFPRRKLSDAFLTAMRDPTCRALQYDWPEGQNTLREWVAERLRHRGADLKSDDVVITAGAQQGLALAAQFLVPAGTRVRVERETYPAALDLFRRRGALLVGEDDPAECAYLVDGIGMPRGQRPSPLLRSHFLQSGLPIIADEAYAELTFDGALPRPLCAEAREEVWHVGTLSKTLSPGLRIGWLVPPRSMVKKVVELKQAIDLQSASLSQAIAESLLLNDDFEARLNRAREFYARRAVLLARALRRHLPDWRFSMPVGGFSIFAETDLPGEKQASSDAPQDHGQKQDTAWLRAAMAHGAAFDPGSLFRPQRSGTLGMRLCYSATPPELLTEAVRRLGTAWIDYRK